MNRKCGAQIRYIGESNNYGYIGALAFTSATWTLNPGMIIDKLVPNNFKFPLTIYDSQLGLNREIAYHFFWLFNV